MTASWRGAALAAFLIAVPAGAASEAVEGNPQAAPEDSSKPKTTKERLESFPLHYALLKNHYDEALAAMPLAEDIDALDPVYGETALGLAAMDESASAYEMVRPLLLTYGADPKLADSRGFTALHYAARAGNYAVAELLLKFGADVDAENPLHEGARITPLWMAYQKNRLRLADFLKQRGAREVDPVMREHLRREAEMHEAVSRAAEIARRLPEEADPELTLRKRFEVMSGATERTLRSQGRIEELEAWLGVKDKFLQSMLETKLPESDQSVARYTLELLANLRRAVSSQPNTEEVK